MDVFNTASHCGHADGTAISLGVCFSGQNRDIGKKKDLSFLTSLFKMVGRPRLERGTNGLKVHCSTN